MPLPKSLRGERVGRAAVLASTLLWGTLWIPLRHLNAAAPNGAWATAAGFALPMLVLLPVALIRRRSIGAGGLPLVRAGVLLAAAIALYADALLRGQIARVILLFYLMPVWSAVLGRVLLDVRISGTRVATIVLGLLGMCVVFGLGKSGLPAPRTVAEWMGLLSGFCWACSMVALRRAPQGAALDAAYVSFLFMAALFVLCALVPGGRSWGSPSIELFRASASWILLFGLVWMPVVLWLTMVGGSRLDPGQVAVLLMLEVVIGLVSAGLLAREPFGWRELVGAICILAACGAEVCSSSSNTALPG